VSQKVPTFKLSVTL